MAGLPTMADHVALRDYVRGADHLQYQNLAAGMVACLVTHSNLKSDHLDIRFDLHWTIEAVKEKLRKHFGTPVEHQRLIYKMDGRVVCEMSDNSRMLGFYSVESGHEIHVIDTDPFSLSRGGGLTDVSLVEKYRMSDDAYDKRKGTIREWIKEQKAKDPKFKFKAKGMQQGLGNYPEKEPEEIPGPESIEGIQVGARCQVMPGKRRGVVKFVGDIEQLKAGPWVGVQFDEPRGSNDGSVKGVKIFECPMSFGAFVRGKNVTTGDFPERDLMDSDGEDEENENEDPQGEDNDDDEI
jgi:tubulin-specific chaperone B